jgi:hypothetical protein
VNLIRGSYSEQHERLPMFLSTLKVSVATLATGAAVIAGSAAPASAAVQDQDGLVNVAIGDITIEDVNVGVAAGIAAQVCGLKVGPVAVLGRAVDRSGDAETVCTVGGRQVTLTQN